MGRHLGVERVCLVPQGSNRTFLGWTATTTVFIAAIVLGIILVALIVDFAART